MHIHHFHWVSFPGSHPACCRCSFTSTVSDRKLDERLEMKVTFTQMIACTGSGCQQPFSLFLCTGCLEQLLENLKPSSSGATPAEIGCPVCHTPTQIDGRNVGQLPKNYGLLEVISSNPSSYMSRVGGLSMAGRGDSPIVQKKEDQTAIFCPDHGDHLSSYCVKDNTLVCSSCLLYGNHKQHKCLLVTEAAKIGREKLQQLNPEVLGQKKRLEEALVDVKSVMERVQTSGGRLVDEMDACFDDLVQFVEERRKRLKLETMERTQVRVQALLEQTR